MINGNGVGKLVPSVLELDTVKGMICLNPFSRALEADWAAGIRTENCERCRLSLKNEVQHAYLSVTK